MPISELIVIVFGAFLLVAVFALPLLGFRPYVALEGNVTLEEKELIAKAMKAVVVRATLGLMAIIFILALLWIGITRLRAKNPSDFLDLYDWILLVFTSIMIPIFDVVHLDSLFYALFVLPSALFLRVMKKWLYPSQKVNKD